MDTLPETSPVQTSPEFESDAYMKEIINKVEGVLDSNGMSPRVPGQRVGFCGFASDLVRRAAEVKGFKSDVFQVMQIHEKIGGNKDDSFQHGFNIVELDGVRYIADESFTQFIDPLTGEIRHGKNKISGNVGDHPIVSKFVHDGYVQLTRESFVDYLKATTRAQDKSYISNLDPDQIFSDDSLKIEYDHTPEELDEYLNGRAMYK